MIGHVFRQGPAIGATLKLVTVGKGQGAPQLPGPQLTETVDPRPRGLIDDYVRVCGGDPKAWAGRLPPHMFPQWGWALITRTLHGVPYDLTKVVNAGCTWRAHGPLPDDQPLKLAARLADIDDDGRRAIFTIELTTGTDASPELLTSTLTVFCPLPKQKGPKDDGGDGAAADKPRDKKQKPTVPTDAHVIGGKKLRANQGWRYCLVSGDFNPIHWLGPYAKMAGFGSVILHGFCTAGIAAETLISNRFAGDIDRLRGLDARFTRPLRLPAEVQVCVTADADADGHPLFVGTAPGGPAFLTGAFHG